MEPFYVAPNDDMSVSIGDDRSTRSDDASIASDRSTSTVNRRQSDRRSHRHRRSEGQIPAASINYHGINIAQAAGQGNLPVCVLLWGMATAKRVNLMDPDAQGNTPMHFAALAELPEVDDVERAHSTNQVYRIVWDIEDLTLFYFLLSRSWAFCSNRDDREAIMRIDWWTPGTRWEKLPSYEQRVLERYQF